MRIKVGDCVCFDGSDWKVAEFVAEVPGTPRMQFAVLVELVRLDRMTYRTVTVPVGLLERLEALEEEAVAAEETCERFRVAMTLAYGHVGVADVQSVPSDDAIIMGHVRAAAKMLKEALLHKKETP